jgi:hypothetical protein
MPERFRQRLQGEIGSQRHDLRAGDDLGDDLADFSGAETEVCWPAKQGPSQLVQDLY